VPLPGGDGVELIVIGNTEGERRFLKHYMPEEKVRLSRS
jgi:hypothetical protein